MSTSRPRLFTYLANSILVVMASAMTGCFAGEVDFDFSAQLQVDLSDADALADIDIELDFDARQGAYFEAMLVRASLFERGSSFEKVFGGESLLKLELGFPDSFDTSFEPGESRTVTLDNLGTRNAEFDALDSYCGELMDLLVEVAFVAADGAEVTDYGEMIVREVRLECESPE